MNERLQRLVADLTLDKVMLQDEFSKALHSPAKQLILVGGLQKEYGACRKRICGMMRSNRKSMVRAEG